MFITLLGLLAGTLNLMNPKAVYIPNGEPGSGAEGFDGIVASVLSSGVLGAVFGLFAALIAWLVKLGVRKANAPDSNNSGDSK